MDTLKTITNMISSIDPGRNPRSTFADYTELLALAFANIPPRRDLDERYKAILKRYQPKQRELFPEITGQLVVYLSQLDKIQDVFGPLYMQLSAGNSKLGQFFTPTHVSRLLAGLTISPEDCYQAVKRQGYIILHEPSCGGGSTILAACQQLRELGYNPQTQVLVKASDLDISCVHMAFAQLGLWGIPAVVKHQNALTGETFADYKTPFITRLERR